MTCIIGYREGESVLLGGDSAGIGPSHEVTVMRQAKVFRSGPAIVGYASSFRFGQIVQHAWTFPERQQNCPLRWMIGEVIPGLRGVLEAQGWRVSDDEGAALLIAAYGRLFQMEVNFDVTEAVDGIMAIGCGAPFAHGALVGLVKSGSPLPADEKVRVALEVSAHCSGGVRPPFHILCNTKGI